MCGVRFGVRFPPSSDCRSETPLGRLAEMESRRESRRCAESRRFVEIESRRFIMRESRVSPWSDKEFKGEIWEEWALTYGRNGSSERKNTWRAAPANFRWCGRAQRRSPRYPPQQASKSRCWAGVRVIDRCGTCALDEAQKKKHATSRKTQINVSAV